MKLENKLRRSLEQVQKDGRYTIKEVLDVQSTRYGAALPVTVLDSSGEERRLLFPSPAELSEQSNLGRMIQAFGRDTSTWPKRKVDVTIGSDGRRTVRPVTK